MPQSSPRMDQSHEPTMLDRLHYKAPHFGPKAKRLVHLFMNGGPSHVDTFDPKPASTNTTASRCPSQISRTERKNRRGHALPYKLGHRPKWHRSERAFFQDRRVHRRHLRHPVHASRCSESRAVFDAHELRGRPPASAESRFVAHLHRARHRESKPARLHRDVPRRISHRRHAKLDHRVGGSGFERFQLSATRSTHFVRF